jgi:hypothetical protein
VMTQSFEARLDARVDAVRKAPPRRSWVAWSPLAGLATAIVVGVVVLGNSGGGSEKPAPQGASGSAASAGSSELAAPGAPAAPPRRVERSTALELSTSRADVQSVADDVIAATQRFGGIVESSQISSSDADASAVFSLRIPTKRLDDALAALSKLAHVASLSQGSTDITGSFVSASDRLHDARAERRGLLTALGQATTTQEIDALKARLRDNRSQISALKGDLDGLRRRANLARVEVTVTGDGQKGDGSHPPGGTWTPGDAAHDALRVLEVAAGVILIGLAAGLPLALIGGLGALAARSGRRRRREGALDAV